MSVGERILEVGGRRVRALICGLGNVLLLHGIRYNCDDWGRLWSLFCKVGSVCVDLPFGAASRSDKWEGTPLAYAQHLSAVLDSLGADPRVVVAPSASAPVAVELARIRPIRAIVLIGPVDVSATDVANLANTVDVHVIWGSEDRVSPVDRAEEFSKAGAKVYIIRGVGHAIHVEDPDALETLLNDVVSRYVG